MVINSSGQGSTIDERVQLLWENDNVNASFTTKTVTIDSNNYKVLIVSVCSTSSAAADPLWTNVIINSTDLEHQYVSTNNRHRPVSITANGLVFGSCVADPLTGSSGDNTNVIPYRIYGLK